VNDANGCSVSGSYSVQSPNVLNGATATGSPACWMTANWLSICPAVASASGPFKVKWCNGLICDSTTTAYVPSYEITGLVAGVYSITVTASNNNVITLNAQVVQSPPAQLSLITLVQPYDDFHNGSISLAPASNCTSTVVERLDVQLFE
jgi:hypothetical protein